MPYARADLLAAVHREGEVLSEEAGDEGMRVVARLEPASVGRFAPWSSARDRSARVPATAVSLRPTRAAAAMAAEHPGGVVDLSVGTPCDPPPQVVVDALCASTRLAGYPPSIGVPDLRRGVSDWFDRRFGISIGDDPIAVCIGTKELVAGIPQWLRLRSPGRDTVLYPEISYPTYAMGAELAGCRAVAVPVDAAWRLDLTAIDPADAARALCLWVNSPGNPAGGLDDLAAAAEWGRSTRRTGAVGRVLHRVHLGRR